MTAAQSDDSRSCGDTDCPCLADWIGTLPFDAGYWTQDNLTAPGPDRLIAPGKNRALPQVGELRDPPPKDCDPATHMVHRLATEEGAALYKRRAATAEPVNGHLKDRTALRRFARRGLPSRTHLRRHGPQPRQALPPGPSPTLSRSHRLNSRSIQGQPG